MGNGKMGRWGHVPRKNTRRVPAVRKFCSVGYAARGRVAGLDAGANAYDLMPLAVKGGVELVGIDVWRRLLGGG